MSELLYVLMHDTQMAICTMHVYHRLSHNFAIWVNVYSDGADGKPLGLSQDPARTLIWVYALTMHWRTPGSPSLTTTESWARPGNEASSAIVGLVWWFGAVCESYEHTLCLPVNLKSTKRSTKQMNRPPTVNIAKGAMREGILSMTALLYELSFLIQACYPYKINYNCEWC